MQPIRTKLTNLILGAPKDWNILAHGPCIGLPVHTLNYADGRVGQYHSFWVVPWIERIKILLGCPVRLSVASNFHPPVALDVPCTPKVEPLPDVPAPTVLPVNPPEPAPRPDFPAA